MKKLLWVALILGLILARKVTAIEYPPLPVAPGKSPTDAPGIPAGPLYVAWYVDGATLDVLEMSSDVETWVDVAGPYETRELDGISNYFVRIPVGYAKAFFRVRRVWGSPWIN